MPNLSQTEWENVVASLRVLKTRTFEGVLVGVGSTILNFSDGSSLLVQCPFEVSAGGTSNSGHGESPATTVILFRLLNKHIVDVSLDRNGRITLEFESGGRVSIIPDNSGFESYVLRTSMGVSPVL